MQKISPQWLTLCPSLQSLGEAAINAAVALDGDRVLPSLDKVYHAFDLVPPGDCRAVILGLDPYPTRGHAMGLAFSVPYGRSWARSLKNIAKEYESDLGFALETSNLTEWANRGVLLANVGLTVKEGKAKSHLKLWEEFTDTWVSALAGSGLPLVWVLWGNDAQKYLPLIEASGDRQRVLISPHPSPLSARRGFFGSKPFSRVNSELASLGQPPVHWSLDVQPALF